MIRKGEMVYAWARDPAIRKAGSSGGFVTGLLVYLLREKLVDAVSTGMRGSDIYDASMVVLTDPDEVIAHAGSWYCGSIFSPKVLLSYLSANPGHRLAVVVKGCEAKAIIELAKRNRFDPDDLLLIGLNCSGTVSPQTARKMIRDSFRRDPDTVRDISFQYGKCVIQTEDETLSISLEELEEGGYGRRLCCQRCLTRIPRQCDVVCGNWGVTGDYAGNSTFVEICSTKGAEIVQSAIQSGDIDNEYAPCEGIERRSRIEKAMLTHGRENQAHQFTKISRDKGILTFIMQETSRCIKCYQCTEGCPLCICTDCRIKKPWLVKPGQVPPPLMFHLIRASHIADSCINCGQCEDRCPMDIPNSLIMNALQAELEELFGYQAGEKGGKPVLAKINELEEWEHNYGDTYDQMVETFRDKQY